MSFNLAKARVFYQVSRGCQGVVSGPSTPIRRRVILVSATSVFVFSDAAVLQFLIALVGLFFVENAVLPNPLFLYSIHSAWHHW